MRIVFFGTFVSAKAGSTAASETIGLALAERGHDVRLVSKRNRPLERAADSLTKAATTSMDLAVLDVFSSRVVHQTALVARILDMRAIPYVAILRGGAMLERYGAIESSLRTILDKAWRTVSPSLFLKAGMSQHGYEVEHLPNPLHLDRFPYQVRDGIEQPIRLLWVRSFSEIYRPTFAIQAVSELRKNGVAATLTMVGPDRGLMDTTRAEAEALGVASVVTFTGPVPNTELYHYYHAHDYLLNTTAYESFGVAVAEAAATGLPVVSAAVGEIAYAWEDEKTIFLVIGESGKDFAECLKRMMRTDTGHKLYRRVSENARAKVEQFELLVVLERWDALLAEVSLQGLRA